MFKEKEKMIKIKKEEIIANPEYFEKRKGIFCLNGFWGIIAYASLLPTSIFEGWLASEIAFRKEHFFDVSIFVYPTREDKMLKELDKQIIELEAKIRDHEKTGWENIESLRKEKDLLEILRDKLILRQSRLFKVNFLFYILSKNKKETENFYNNFEKRMRGFNLILSRVRYKILEAYKALLPGGNNFIKETNLVDSEFLTACFPFTYPNLIQNSGILYGFEAFTGTPIIIDRFKLAGHNEIVVGKIGSGKSFFAKLETLRWYLRDPNVKIYLIDPLSGFEDLSNLLKAQVIRVGERKINPLDLFLSERAELPIIIREKLSDLIEFFSIFYAEIGEKLDKVEAGILRKAIMKAYKQGGLKNGAIKNVTIEDIYDKLSTVAENREEKQAAERIRSSFEAFKADLSMFNGFTEINVKNRIVYFDFSGIRSTTITRPLIMHAILSWISARIRGDTGKKIVVIDEAHYFLSNKNIRSFLERNVRHSRHYKAGYTFITQGFDELIRNREGLTILTNTDIFVIFKQDFLPVEIAKMLNISKTCEKLVKEAVQGKVEKYSSALLVLPGKDAFYINVTCSPAEKDSLSLSGRGI